MPRAKTGVESFIDRQVSVNEIDEEFNESDANSVITKASTSTATNNKRKTAGGSNTNTKKKKTKSEFDVILTLPDEEVLTNKVKIGSKDCLGLEANGKAIVLCKFWTSKTAAGKEKVEFFKFKYRMPISLIPNLIDTLNVYKKQLKI